MLTLTLTLVRLWTRLYTSGMPAALCEARRAEIESDLWESSHASDRPPGAAGAVHVLLRLLRGVPDDLLWRAELMDLKSRRRTGVWIATATIALLSTLWVRASLRPPELPQLPLSPVTMSAWLMKPIPPPPPPPPPPPSRSARAMTRGVDIPPLPPPAPSPRRCPSGAPCSSDLFP